VLYSTFLYILDAGLALGLLCMALAYLFKTRIRHRTAMAGYFIYAVYWTFWTVLYFTLENNPTNAIFTIMGMGVFSYLGYHEYVNYRKNEYLTSMEWAAKGTAITAFCYLLIERVEVVGGYIVYGTAWQTAKIMNWIGYEPDGIPVTLGRIAYGLEGPGVDLIGSGAPQHHEITIILACTGIQAMILFLAFNIFLKAELKRKFYGFLMTIPVIYVANQFRNIAIIYLSNNDVDFGTGMDPFELAHNWIGKIFSFLVLIGIVIYTFKMLPEALDNLFTLYDLQKRKQGVVEDGKLILPSEEDACKAEGKMDEESEKE